ncbi:MAG: dihydroneopterin aldolase [Proteobacteria bacterium]|nr:dihydroneopterin aldolase [Pseudomonadota bacterium]MDA1058700.1 dihydroneopterin aldolase [Pseudomonadota bacterium]
MTSTSKIQPLRLADAESGVRHVFVRDLVLQAEIGVHRHEKRRQQPIRVNIDLTVKEDARPLDDRLENVVDYETLIEGVRRLIGAGHINLVETLAEQIAGLALSDSRVITTRVRVEKLQVVKDAESVGVEIERRRSGLER